MSSGTSLISSLKSSGYYTTQTTIKASTQTKMFSAPVNAAVVSPSKIATNAIASTASVPLNKNSYPSFWSAEGQSLGLQRVTGIFNPFGGGISLTNPFTGNQIISLPGARTAITIGEVAGLTYGGALAYSAIAPSSVASVPIGSTLADSIASKALLVGGGIAAGALLFSKGTDQTQGITQQPTANQTQSPTATQNTNQQPTVTPSQSGSIFQSGAGDYAYLNQSQNTNTYNYPTATPEQYLPLTQNATLPTTATETATASTDWLLPALLVGGAVLLFKN